MLGVFVSPVPHPRINVGDCVENLIVDRSLLPVRSSLVVTCVHHSVLEHGGKAWVLRKLTTSEHLLRLEQMANLTKEYFDQRVTKLDNKIDAFAKSVKTGFQNEHDYMEKQFTDIIKMLDVRQRVDELERKVARVEQALNVKL